MLISVFFEAIENVIRNDHLVIRFRKSAAQKLYVLFFARRFVHFDKSDHVALVHHARHARQKAVFHARNVRQISVHRHNVKAFFGNLFYVFRRHNGGDFVRAELILIDFFIFDEPCVVYAGVIHRVRYSVLAVVSGKAVHHTEHGKAHEAQQNGKEQADGLGFKTARAHFEAFLNRHSGLYQLKSRGFREGYLSFVRRSERFHTAVFIYSGRAANLLRQFVVHGKHRFLFRKIRVYFFNVLLRKLVSLRKFKQFSAVVRQTVFGFFGIGAVFFDVGNNLSVLKFNNPVAVLFRKISVVRNHQHQLVFRKLFQRVENLNTRVAVQRARRLVGHNDFGVFHQSSGNRHSLLLPARKLIRLSFTEACKVNFLQNFVYLLVRGLPSLKLKRQSDVCSDVEVLQNVVFLKNESEICVPVAVEIALRKIF